MRITERCMSERHVFKDNMCPLAEQKRETVNVSNPSKNILFLCRYEVAPRSDSEDSGSEEEEEEEVYDTVNSKSEHKGQLLFSSSF